MSASSSPARTRHWPRRVTPELLDALPANDPHAQRSRRDLRRINRIMGARSSLLRALDLACTTAPARLVELGAGDGTMALRLARARARRWPRVRLTLLDRAPSVETATAAAIESLGWSVEIAAMDVFDWLASPDSEQAGVVFANLFVHHFEGAPLGRLFDRLATRCDAFVCCEPRRARGALAGSHLLGLIGCNAVTRHDAVVSVQAGFREQELSSLWHAVRAGGWHLHEASAGLFSHLFVARRSA